MDLKELVTELAKALVNKPEEVSVDEIKGASVTVYSLKVAKEDIGIVIGRGGRTATAIRHLLFSASAKLRRNVVLDIEE